MSKRTRRKLRAAQQAINWKRVRKIFHGRNAPEQVWERQFDFSDEKLHQLAQSPYDKIRFSDLGCYYDDLAFVELQPDLFAYLFPVCLMHWHVSLMNNDACAEGGAEFHWAIHHGNVLNKMLTDKQREAVVLFFRDSFLKRLDLEQKFADQRNQFPSFGWIYRFNSLGLVIPTIDVLWDTWWELETPGRAVAALQYLSALMYEDGLNPLFEVWSGAIPDIWENDSGLYGAGWLDENIGFLTTTLTLSFVNDKAASAVERLHGQEEWDKARQLEQDLPSCQELIRERIRELPELLRNPIARGWSE